MTDLYKRYFLKIDTGVAALVTVAFLGFVYVFWGTHAFESSLYGQRQILYSATAQLSGALLGFILAAASIIVVLVPSPRFRILRDSGNYPKVFEVYFRAITWLGITCIVSFIALLADTDPNPKIPLTFVVIFLSLMSASRLGHSIAILRKITKIAAQSDAA